MKYDKYAIYIIWLVAIVVVVSLVAVFTSVNSETVAAQAGRPCFDSDGGLFPYIFGITSGIIYGNGLGFRTYEDACWNEMSGIDNSCDNCVLWEFYCDNGFVEYRLYYTDYNDGIHCEDGKLASGDLDDPLDFLDEGIADCETSEDDAELPVELADEIFSDSEGDEGESELVPVLKHDSSFPTVMDTEDVNEDELIAVLKHDSSFKTVMDTELLKR